MVPVLGPSSSLSSSSLGCYHNVEVPLLLPLLLPNMWWLVRGCIEARAPESVTIIITYRHFRTSPKSHYVHFWYFPTQSHVTDKKLAGSIAFSYLTVLKPNVSRVSSHEIRASEGRAHLETVPSHDQSVTKAWWKFKKSFRLSGISFVTFENHRNPLIIISKTSVVFNFLYLWLSKPEAFFFTFFQNTFPNLE